MLMNELLLLLIAICCAAGMGTLARSGVEANLRVAIRTTLILSLGWALAWGSRRNEVVFSLRTWALLALSAVAISLSWALYLWFHRRPPTAGPALMDRMNVVLAAAFAVVFFYGRSDADAWLYGLLIVAGAFILARKPRRE